VCMGSSSSDTAAASSDVSPSLSGSEAATSLSSSSNESPARRCAKSHVRCLGWDSLPYPAAGLSEHVSTALQGLAVPFTAKGQFVFLCEGTHAEKPISVHIQILEDVKPGHHHLQVRRQGGCQWTFSEFYSKLRAEISRALGLNGPRDLSSFSPLVTKREVAPGVSPAVGFERRSLQPVPEEAMPPPPGPPTPIARGIPLARGADLSPNMSVSTASASIASVGLASAGMPSRLQRSRGTVGVGPLSNLAVRKPPSGPGQ